MGKMSRDKGARGEREVCAILKDHGYPHARRYLAGDGFQPGDIDGGPAEWVIEVKWWGDVTAATREGLKQAHEEAATSGRPYAMAAIRLDGSVPASSHGTRWVAVLHADTWIKCGALGAPEHVHHDGTVPARLALTLHSGGLCNIGKGLLAMPFVEWLNAVGSN